jgi:hypothetical protein
VPRPPPLLRRAARFFARAVVLLPLGFTARPKLALAFTAGPLFLRPGAGPPAGSGVGVRGFTPAKPQSHWQITLMLHSALSPLKPSSALLAGNPWKVKGVNGARVAHDHVGTRGGPIPGTRHGTRFEHIKWQWVDDIMDEPNGGATTEGTMAAAAAARAVRVLAAPRAAIVPPVGCVLLWQTTRGSRVYR